MTKREMYTAIINGELTDEVVVAAKAELERLNATNEKRKGKKAAEQATVDEKVIAYVTNEPQLAKEIRAKVNADIEDKTEHYSLSKVVASLSRLINDKKVTANKDIEGSKAVKRYKLA